MEDNKDHTIGIVREEKNKWERRVVLTPKEVKVLVDKGIRVLIQPSTNRWFTQKEFEDVGAIFQEDLSEAEVILGVKEVPIENLIADKTYMFFSHTIKAQDYNMPLLDKLLELNIRMIDYECIREDKQRLVAFGRFAGMAGTVDFLRGIGEFLLEKKYQSFFVNVASTYMYVDLADIKESLTKVGVNIGSKGLPPEFAPYVFGVTSKGRVAQGALEILELFPHEYVEPDQLDTIPKDDNTKIYITVLTQKDLVERKDGEVGEFDKKHYYENPSKYRSKFHNYYDKISFLINCMYWEAKFPRVIIEDELCEQENMKLMGFTDISADFEGSIEITRRFSDIEEPFHLYSPKTRKLKMKISEYEEGDILYHWVDHLPAEMPIESSMHFGEKLLPFLKDLVRSDTKTPFEELNDIPDVIKQAILCCNGKLTPNYKYISQLRKYNELQKKEDEEIAQMKTKSKGLKRSISFTSLCLSGHIFDTHFFNDAIDLLEKAKANFRVLNIKMGQRTTEESTATLQIFTHDVWKLNSALDQLYELAENKPVEIIKNYDNKISGDD